MSQKDRGIALTFHWRIPTLIRGVMDKSHSDGKNAVASLTIESTPRALAEINYNSLVAAEKTTSSDDDGPDPAEIPAESARTAIGVSISHEQTRLTSPQTPAAEKVAAIERAGGFFGVDGNGREATLVEEPEEEEEEEESDIGEHELQVVGGAGDNTQVDPTFPASRIPERSPRKTPIRLPSPWRAESSVQWYQSTRPKSSLLEGFFFNRKRSSSGPESTFAKSLLSSLPSMPKAFSLGSTFTNENDDKANTSLEPEKPFERSSASSLASEPESEPDSSIGAHRGPDVDKEHSLERNKTKDRHTVLEAVVSPTSTHTVRSRAALLRRSTSDQSLVTHRTLSRVESLGDDSRFENVQDQVNSRLKAIKDSWQDSNIRLPSLPNLSIASFTPDFIRERSGSLNKKQSVKQIDIHTTSRAIEPAKRPVDPITRQPFSSAREAVNETTPGKTTTHPHFKRALEHLEGDVVILGGYRGSILRSAEPPHRQVWVPVKVGLNIRKVDLQVSFEEDGDERATDRVIPGGMLTHIGPVDIARRLFKRLRACKNAQSGKLRVHDYGYDWRLDPAYLSKQLVSFLEDLPSNRTDQRHEMRGAIVIAHSLGGLITRHAVNRRPELVRGVVYAGVPSTCVNILGPMRNGDEVLLSNRVLTAQVNFSIRTSFALLPLDGRCFFDKNTREVCCCGSQIMSTLASCILTSIAGISRGLLRPGDMGRSEIITLRGQAFAASCPSSSTRWNYELRFIHDQRAPKPAITRTKGQRYEIERSSGSFESDHGPRCG